MSEMRSQFEDFILETKGKHADLLLYRVDLEFVGRQGITEDRMGEYVNVDVEGLWQCWQASRAAGESK